MIYRVVDAEGFVACEGNRYSVPWKKTHPGDALQTRFAEFGEVATQFLDGLWQAQRHALSQASLILELSGHYRRPDFVAALERAVRFGAYSLSSVRRILEINAAVKTPAPVKSSAPKKTAVPTKTLPPERLRE